MNKLLNTADLLWILKFVDNYTFLIEEYPELFKQDEIDDAKVVRQIVKEKLGEDINIRY